MNAVDLFAGPGGWELGARPLGLSPVGIERDRWACATRRAAGLVTVRGRVQVLDPADFAPVELLIASPPCPTFSAAGKRSGVTDFPIILDVCRELVAGIDRRDERRAEVARPESLLVVEPLRWALELRPRLIALEQVPPVLDLWRFFADVLTLKLGYSCWSGVLSAERFGVPQTRARAFLLARLDGPVSPPAPTHTAFRPGEERRGELPLDGELLPWVSMADALGWDHSERVGFARRNDRDDGGEYRARDLRSADAPAFGMTEKARSWLRERQSHGVARSVDEPAMTLTSSMDNGNFRWEVNTGRDWQEGGDRGDAQRFNATEQPAPTVDGKGRWFAHVRPATTVQGDPRIAQPGHKRERLAPGAIGRMEDAVRVSLDDAAVLQGFPRGYPFRGNSTERFRQVGNAVPPPLARAVLSALTGRNVKLEEVEQ